MPVHTGEAAHGEVEGVHFVRLLEIRAPAFGGHQLNADGSRQPRNDLVLHIEEVGARLVESLSPQMRARFGVDQLRVDAHAIAACLYAPL